jgi:anti-anti-sigma factor
MNDRPAPGQILVANHDGVYLMKFVGDVRVTLCTAVDNFLESMLEDPEFRSVVIDLTRTDGIDSTSLGVLAKLSIRTQEKFGFIPTLVSTRPDITRVLRSMGFDDVFHIVEEPLVTKEQFGELAPCDCSEDDLRNRVLDAHRVLMSLSTANRQAFQDLVETLEAAAR